LHGDGGALCEPGAVDFETYLENGNDEGGQCLVLCVGVAWQRAAMRRPWDSVIWWELRRIPFNILMLVAGALSGAAIVLIGSHFALPGEDIIEPLLMFFGAIAYGVFANLAYTLGWITELLWSWGDTERTEAMRPRIFWVGVAFSVTLTLLPALLVPLIWIIFGFQHV